ncbi:hypothetical protein TNCT_525861 [Trichonephila clavata]|uniref:C2H2-type domain-containing protein n=1 Tax=Trichonephila clavata TaxID=2740835 RepID=A0A8X6KL28_TRICU|nr:hypothetical protein TNCT_525861 [Trichonephila clavata]
MDQSTGKYQCKSCNLKFKDYKQHFSHRYQQHEEELRLENNKDDGESQNSLSDLKNCGGMDIGQTFFKKQLTNNNWTDSTRDVLHHSFEFRDHGAIQIHDDSLTDCTSMPPFSKNDLRFRQGSLSQCHSSFESNPNELHLALKDKQKELCLLEGKPQVDTFPPSIIL